MITKVLFMLLKLCILHLLDPIIYPMIQFTVCCVHIFYIDMLVCFSY